MTIRIVFMGSPDFALPTLRELAAHYNVVGVVTQPDRPSGRGMVFTPPPVKKLAESLNIPVIQPEKMKAPEAMAQLVEWNPDVIIVAAFGQILRAAVLDLPKYGCVNVHASLLPRWRGAAPIQACILHGDEKTGVTIMKMDAGIDTGAMLSQCETKIEADDNAGTLSDRLAEMGAKLLIETLPGYLAGEIQPREQDHSAFTYAPMMKKEDGVLDFSQPADYLERKVRAYQPWPGAFFLWQNQPMKVIRAAAKKENTLPVGQTGIVDKLPAVGTEDGTLLLLEVQPAGKKPMPGKVFLQGARTWGEPIHE